MTVSQAPCKNCEERHLNCHDDCPKYKEWQAFHEKVKENERKQNRLYDWGFREAFRGRNKRQ